MNSIVTKFTSSKYFLAGLAAMVLLLVLPVLLPSYGVSLLTQVLIFGIFAMSLDLLIGYAGLISFNHATFFGVSGYAVGILATREVNNFWLSLGVGIVISAAVAAVIGSMVLRSKGPYFLIITLAFGQMVFALAWKWRSLTGGDDGLPGIPRPEAGLPVSMWKNEYFYYLVLIFLILSFIILKKLMNSTFGKSVIGIRESESRMQALGYNTWSIKYVTYILAAIFSGLAGVLHAYYAGFVSPQDLNWTLSGLVMLMVIIGGAGTLVGPLAGAGIVLIIQNVISSYTERWQFFMGAIFILCVMYARHGLAGVIRRKYESIGNKKSL